ncbi:MAG TPA: peptidase M, neutral zinc metallopeptidase site [Nostocaceae cyanobacterium]|nr:peptidase M, neutral zinc metallopeptidase site [Nostocaceae cyanobacterium]
MGIFNIFKQVQGVFEQISLSQRQLQQAEILAQNKRVYQAVQIAEEILLTWSNSSSLLEQITRQVALGELLDNVRNRLQVWQNILNQVNQLANQAKSIINTDPGNPLETHIYSQALSLYQQCLNLVDDDQKIIQAIQICERVITQRLNFKNLIAEAENQVQKLFFQSALNIYQQASQLYKTAALEKAITHCYSQLEPEKIYTDSIREAQQAATAGKLKIAISIIESALNKFPRSDGIETLEKLQRTLKGKQNYRAGLIAEKQGDINTAIHQYQEAAFLLPDPTECIIRQAILAIKNNDSSQVINLLENINTPQTNYIRGLAYYQQGNFQQAAQAWQGLTGSEITQQKEILQTLAERKRLTAIKEIESLVDSGNLEIARTASLIFIQDFPENNLVKTNLIEHIQPRLDLAEWQSQDWEKLAKNAEKVWSEEYNIKALHNLAIATYYYTQIDSSQLAQLIIVWSTALANIHLDPALQDIAWMINQPINLDDVCADLQKLLSELIEKVKEQDLKQYFHLRDLYRREMSALGLIKNSPHAGFRFKNLVFLPGYYLRYRHQLRIMNFPAQIWGALYTDWGLAVAACLEGDTARAIQIQPLVIGNSVAEQFAREFVSYYEGRYYLQQQKWTKAVNPLQVAKAHIKTTNDWYAEIDRLCGIQRQAITEFTEHLDFAQVWYNLLGSPAAKAYLAEYKAEEIRDKLVNEKISEETAIHKLEELKEIDADNPILIDLLERLRFNREMKKVFDLLKQNKYTEAVKEAKKSSHPQVRHKLADIYLEILVNGFQKRELGFAEICELGNWVYELAPDDVGVQEIYNFTKELEEVYNLMKVDRFDDAVRRAKRSDNEHIRFYVAEFFILTLIKGLEERNLPFELINKLGKWAYELCPYEPAFQDIYRSMNLLY